MLNIRVVFLANIIGKHFNRLQTKILGRAVDDSIRHETLVKSKFSYFHRPSISLSISFFNFAILVRSAASASSFFVQIVLSVLLFGTETGRSWLERGADIT